MKLTLLTFALGAALYAQTAPTLGRLYTYKAAPGAASDLFDLQRDTAEIYKAGKSTITRLVWTSLAGEQLLYMYVPNVSLADLNEPTWLSKQGTDQERTGRQMRLARAIESADLKILAEMPELTWDGTPDGPPDAFAAVSTVRVKPGRVEAFTNMAKELNAVTKQLGKAKSIYTSRTRYGGNVYEFHIVTGYASLADITTSPQEFRKAMGEAKFAAYLKSNAENVESVESQLIRFRPEFSYIPAK